MRKRSRVLALLLAAGLAVGLCGCSGSADSVAGTTSPPPFPVLEPTLEPAPTLESTPEPTPTPEPTSTPEPELHGLVMIEGYGGHTHLTPRVLLYTVSIWKQGRKI